eukprot:15350390-Ditylum_brightwellii.AAC.1
MQLHGAIKLRSLERCRVGWLGYNIVQWYYVVGVGRWKYGTNYIMVGKGWKCKGDGLEMQRR